eukprot:4346396-Ditylum_brightwellii.AAC.1
MLKTACNTAGVAILAVDTSIISNTVLSKSMKANFTGMLPHFVLQHAVLEDTKHLIQMLQDGDSAFANYGVTNSAVGNRITVINHSTGRGSSFPTADEIGINYVFTMTTAFGEEDFNPITEGMQKQNKKNTIWIFKR